MAVIWQRKSGDNHYEIRTAGQTRRLYTNKVCHSQYNPAHLFTGSIWDLLFLPALFLKNKPALNILILGVGGGAVIRQLLAMMPVKKITGIELDENHCYIAKRFFGLDDEKIELVNADARYWVNDYSGEKFHMIIDDVFTDVNNQPVRAIAANSQWIGALHKMLRPDGILTMNYASQQEMRQSAIYQDEKTKSAWHSLFQITLPTLENHVACLTKNVRESKSIHDAIMYDDRMERAFRTKQLQYRIRKMRI